MRVPSCRLLLARFGLDPELGWETRRGGSHVLAASGRFARGLPRSCTGSGSRSAGTIKVLVSMLRRSKDYSPEIHACQPGGTKNSKRPGHRCNVVDRHVRIGERTSCGMDKNAGHRIARPDVDRRAVKPAARDQFQFRRRILAGLDAHPFDRPAVNRSPRGEPRRQRL